MNWSHCIFINDGFFLVLDKKKQVTDCGLQYILYVITFTILNPLCWRILWIYYNQTMIKLATLGANFRNDNKKKRISAGSVLTAPFDWKLLYKSLIQFWERTAVVYNTDQQSWTLILEEKKIWMNDCGIHDCPKKFRSLYCHFRFAQAENANKKKQSSQKMVIFFHHLSIYVHFNWKCCLISSPKCQFHKGEPVHKNYFRLRVNCTVYIMVAMVGSA